MSWLLKFFVARSVAASVVSITLAVVLVPIILNMGFGYFDTIDRIGSRLGSWFGSNNTTSGGGIPAEQIFSPSGTII